MQLCRVFPDGIKGPANSLLLVYLCNLKHYYHTKQHSHSGTIPSQLKQLQPSWPLLSYSTHLSAHTSCDYNAAQMATTTATTTATTIEARFAQVHPNLKPAPIYKMSSLTNTAKPTPKPKFRITRHEVARMVRFKRYGHLFEPDEPKRCMGAGTPPRAIHYGILRRTTKTMLPEPAPLTETIPQGPVKSLLTRFAHLRDPDLVKPTIGLGTPSHAKNTNTGDLRAADHHTPLESQELSDCSFAILDIQRRRSPAQRLNDARELFDHRVEDHEEHDDRGFCCDPKYWRYLRPDGTTRPRSACVAADRVEEQEGDRSATATTEARVDVKVESEEGAEAERCKGSEDLVIVEPVIDDNVALSACWARITWRSFRR